MIVSFLGHRGGGCQGEGWGGDFGEVVGGLEFAAGGV